MKLDKGFVLMPKSMLLRHRVAVYGSLRRGLHNHHKLLTGQYLGNCRTEKQWHLYDLGPYPALVKGGDTAVVLEVYAVDARTLALLDELEGYPVHYRRERIATPFGDSWVYYQTRPDTGHRGLVESGDWKDRVANPAHRLRRFS